MIFSLFTPSDLLLFMCNGLSMSTAVLSVRGMMGMMGMMGLLGLSDCWIIGLLDYWIVRLLDCRLTRLEVIWQDIFIYCYRLRGC